MKIVAIEPLLVSNKKIEEARELLEKKGCTFKYYNTRPIDQDEVIKRANQADILLVGNYPIKKETLEKMHNLKLIQVAFTGIDHIQSTDVEIRNASGYSDTAVSELVIGLALERFRNISKSNADVRQAGTAKIGREISGKSVGIVGLGRIGLRVAKLFEAFSAEVFYYSRTKKDVPYRYLELDELLSTCDIISIHTPLNDSTRGLINSSKIDLIKKGALIINCARGPIVDEKALVKRLKNGEIDAAIDVFDSEPPLDRREIFDTDALLQPHQAYLTEEAMIRRFDIALKKIINFIDERS